MFTGILHTEIDSVWQDALPWIEGACRRSGKYEPDDIYAAIASRGMQLWVYRDFHGVAAVCITEIIKYPRKTYARILVGAGRNRRDWQGSRKIIEQWARAQGCDGIESIARKGWAKVFDDYTLTHVFLEKEF